MQKPVTFSSLEEMPSMVVSLATMEWNRTGTWRYLKPRYENKVPPCNHGCPAGNDIEGFIRLAEQGRYTDAWAKLKEENPLTRVCGRVCFHPCETACNRKRFDQSVSINALERYVGEHADRSRLQGMRQPDTGKRVAVIGSGPAGLSAAFYLARLGHGVTVFEKMQAAGGILRYGIPEHRLPRSVLDDEIEDIRSLGVEFRCGVAVGEGGLSYTELSRFDAVFIAVGAHRSRSMKIPGEDAPQVMSGLDLLRRAASGEKVEVGGRVAVVGGGNTACDAARVARRLGAQVEIYYRRGRAEMPAFADEVDDAVREGVGLNVLVAPTRVELDGAGNVEGLTLVRMALGEPDESGRRSPRPQAGSEFRVVADTVVTAIGELVDPTALPGGLLVEDDGSVATDPFGKAAASDASAGTGTGAGAGQSYWAGGDVTPMTRTVVTAVAAGKRAAIAIDLRLRGRPEEEVGEVVRVGPAGPVSMSHYLGTAVAHGAYDAGDSVVRYDDLNTAHFTQTERARAARLDVAERLRGFEEVNRGLTDAQAAAEASRCFHCGICTECDNCFVFCPDVAVKRREGGGYDIDYDFCKGCGICVAECPRASMALSEE